MKDIKDTPNGIIPLGNNRDYVGYGKNIPVVAWPGGARVAVSLVLNYEEGSERSFDVDGQNETMGENVRTIEGLYRDFSQESSFEYGSRAGVHRIMRLLKRHGLPCTVFAAAMALERNPSVVEWIREDQHEPCAHGWRWSESWHMSREMEKETICMAVESITRTCGVRPVGWFSRRMRSQYTRELLVEEGGFIYDSDATNDDIPYYTQVGNKSHLIIPYSVVLNDGRYLSGQIPGPDGFFDVCRRAFDVLWDEGATHPRMMSIGLHARWTGQPARLSALQQFLEHAVGKGGAWFARRRDIAGWWLRHHPAEAMG